MSGHRFQPRVRRAGGREGALVGERRDARRAPSALAAGSISAMMKPGSVPASARILPHGSTIMRVTVGVAPVLMMAALRRGDDERTRLDRPRPDQHVPVRLAGRLGERRRESRSPTRRIVPARGKDLGNAHRSRPSSRAAPKGRSATTRLAARPVEPRLRGSSRRRRDRRRTCGSCRSAATIAPSGPIRNARLATAVRRRA